MNLTTEQYNFNQNLFHKNNNYLKNQKYLD